MIRTGTRWLLLALALSLAGGGVAQAQEKKKILKIASLAPEGSSWMKLFHQWAGAIEKRSPGLKITFFAGGVSGDEKDVVRKMKNKALHGAAVTAIGLGLIQPEVRVLEIPFFLRTYDQLDWVREKLDTGFRTKFRDRGYELLFWGDVGQVQLFTNVPIDSNVALKKMKIWAWTDDPMVKKLYAQVGLNSEQLGVPDVLPALQTGRIDACYGSTLSTLALQWNTKVKYVTTMITGQSVGATVMTKETWDSLSPDEQKAVREESDKIAILLRKTIRDDNVRALTKMKALGLQEIPTPNEVVAQFQEQARKVAVALDGQVYTKDFRLQVEALAAQCPPDRCKK